MNRKYILDTLKHFRDRRSCQYGIRRIGIFGSCAKGTNNDESDVDVVIEMEDPDIFAMVHIKEELEEILNSKVDIVRKRQRMNPFLKNHIDKEAIYM